MMLCDFSVKRKFTGTELPIIEEDSHSYKTSRYPRKKGYGSNEKKRHSTRSSTATRYPRESFDSDNSLLLATGNLRLDIDPYLAHNESGWQSKPEGRGSEKNDDRRTRTPWIYDLEKRKHQERVKRGALDAVRRALFRYRIDPYSWSDKPNYKPVSNYT